MTDIVEILHDRFDLTDRKIEGSNYLDYDLCLDSLEVTDLVATLEEMYDISIPDDDFDPCYDMTIDGLISLVQKFSN